MNLKWVVCFCIFHFFIVSIGIAAREPNVRIFNKKDGLSGGYYCVYQDKFGFIWFGADNGLTMFDGYSFKSYVYSEKSILNRVQGGIVKILPDVEGDFWLLTEDKNLLRFDYNQRSFDHITFISGLNDVSSVDDIVVDKEGVAWVVADGFLCRTTPEREFVVDKKIEKWLVDNSDYATSIITDDHGVIWLQTLKGMIQYGANLDQIEYVFKYGQFGEEISIKDNFKLFKDSRGIIWIPILTTFFHYNTNTKQVSQLPRRSHNKKVNRNLVYKDILEDRYGCVWVSSWSGSLMKYSYDSKRNQYFIEPTEFLFSKDKELSNTGRNGVLAEDGSLWFATGSYGLIIYDGAENNFMALNHENDLTGKMFNDVRFVFKDRDNKIWFTGLDSQIGYHSPEANRFNHIKIVSEYGVKAYGNNIHDIIHDTTTNKTWVATQFQGLHEYRDHKLIKQQEVTNKKQEAVTGQLFSVVSLNKNLLLSGSSKGLSIYNINDKAYTVPTSVGNWNEPKRIVRDLFNDGNGNIWVGTWGDGLFKYDVKESNFTRYFEFKPSLETDCVNKIIKDSQGNLWMGNNKCLRSFDPSSNRWKYYLNDFENSNSIQGKIIHSIYEDSKQRLWIGSNAGLSLLQDEKFTNYNLKNGLKAEEVCLIVEDEGYLWLGTDAGISRFDPLEEKFVNFGEEDGLDYDVNFLRGGALKLESGEILFGGSKGLFSFEPSEFIFDQSELSVQIYSIYIDNTEIFPNDQSGVLEENILSTKEIKFTHDQNNFGFAFSALRYEQRDKVKYAYILDGWDTNWRTIDFESNEPFTLSNKVYFNHVNPGNYTFKVKAYYENGSESAISAIKIRIAPPLWATWWAYLIYCLLLILVVYGVFKLLMVQNRLSYESLYHLRDKELFNSKMTFFTNISHEFRTPLTLILAPLERIVTSINMNEKEMHKYISIVYRNSKRLEKLVNQLLEFRRMESGYQELDLQNRNIVRDLETIKESFDDLAKQKNINFKLVSKLDSLMLPLDLDKLEKIMYNLLGNAFRFCESGDLILIEVQQEFVSLNGKSENADKRDTEVVKITVSDSGIGIRDEKLSTIFEYFSTDGANGSYAKSGTGIGLALTKSLVEMHGGTISVWNNPKSGASFSFTIPCTVSDHAKIDISSPEIQSTKDVISQEEIELPRQVDHQANTSLNSSSGTILVVDDNEDIRSLLYDFLCVKYKVLMATNGLEGINIAQEKSPDLIISDVMMPNMDGLELCKHLKSDQSTSHIPIILLTARSGMENELQGLETGADDYLVKPFNLTVLNLKIANILTLRQALRDKFNSGLDIMPQEVATNSVDRQFIERTIKAIDDHLDDTDFTHNELAKELGVSQKGAYNKIKGLTGLSVHEFIKKVRIKRACTMILSKSYNISEVAYKVGFKSVSYFSIHFKKEMGIPPSEYLNKHVKDETVRDDINDII